MHRSSQSILGTLTAGIVLVVSACSPLPVPTPVAPIPLAGAPALAPSTPPVGASPTAAATAAALATATPAATATDAATSTPALSPTPLPLVVVRACGEITAPGYYKLQNDLKSPAGHDCFTVLSHDVVFDCDHHTIEGSTANITGDQYAFYAFLVRKYGLANLETPTNVEIKNCTVLHYRNGIFISESNDIYIHDNNLSNNYDDVDQNRFGIFLGPPPDGGGLRLDAVHGARLENNIANNEAIGINLRDSDSITVRGNTTDGNSAWGISLLNTSHSEVSNNTVRDNIRYCEWGNGTVGRGCDAGGIILHDGASHDVVNNNTIAGQNGNGIFIKSHATRCGDDNLIENNRITDAVYNGIEMGYCDGDRVIGNEISGSFDGVFFAFSSNTEIRGNVIRNMNNHGIISANSHDTTVADNQIVNAREGIYLYWTTYDPKAFFFLTPSPDNYASRDNTITNNSLRDNSVAGIHLSNSIQDQVTNNTFANNAKSVWVEGKIDGDLVTGQ